MFLNPLSRDIQAMLDHLDQTFDRFWTRSNGVSQSGGSPYGYGTDTWRAPEGYWTPAIESAWTDDAVHLRVILPGVAEEDVHLTARRGRLTLEAERRIPEDWHGGDRRTQLSYGKFVGTIPVADGLDLDHVRCRLHDGVLDIEIPLAESMRPRQIEIGGGTAQKALAA